MSKAYDMVEWAFLKFLLDKMNFPSHFIDLIMECVTSMEYSVLLNGEMLPSFRPERGLRQGDPLSPYLFILVTEAFSYLIQQAQLRGKLSGVSIAKEAPVITHLFFADDNLLFGKVNTIESGGLQSVSSKYGAASDQRINFEKSSIVFSANTKLEDRASFCQELGVTQVQDFGKYLGMPTHVGRNKAAVLNKLKDSVWASINSWSAQLLSQAGKEVLIKAVAQSNPVFYIPCFKIPAAIIDDLDRMISHFWWGKSGGKRGIYWAKWLDMCTSKLKGGLGFRDFSCFNDAL